MITAAAATVAVIVGGLVLAAQDDNETGGAAGDQVSATNTTVPRVGFIGLPPEGATPSTPEGGEIVVSIRACSTPTGLTSDIGTVFPDLGELTVLADGLLIWQKYDDLPEGANSLSTGLLEQRLTPEGVELMRSEASAALSSGEPQPNCDAGDHDGYFVYPGDWDSSGILHADHLARVIDPWSWLPASAWEDPEIRAYVPSAYVVRITGDSHERETLDPEIRAQLPAAAADLLDANRIDGDAYERQLGYAKLTPDEARAFAAALDDAGLEQDELWNAYQLGYEFVYDDTVVRIEFLVYDLDAMMVYPGTPPGA